MNPKPAKYDIRISRGVTLEEYFKWKISGVAVVLHPGYTAEFTLSPNDGSADVVVPCGIEQDTLGEDFVHVLVTDEETLTYAWEQGQWWLNIEEPSGKVWRIVEGVVRVRD